MRIFYYMKPFTVVLFWFLVNAIIGQQLQENQKFTDNNVRQNVFDDLDKPVVSCLVGPCEPAKIDSNIKVCVGHIQLTASATDNITREDDLMFEYKFDLYNDGRGVHGGYDFRVGKLSKHQHNTGDTVEYGPNPFADDYYNPFKASGTYPIGIHRIRWNVCDSSGNVGVCETLFEIKDCLAPIPKCKTGLLTWAIPSTGKVTILANDLDFGSFDNCSSKDKLKFYFDGDINKTSIMVTCDDFIASGQCDQLRFEVEMWVEDEEENRDYCKALIIVLDSLDACINGDGATISGIVTEENKTTRVISTIQLETKNQPIREVTKSNFRFNCLYTPSTYKVLPIRNDDPLNGISTRDILRIQNHVLGKKLISTPYRMIAADVNASNSITAADIVEMRKLILGIIPSFRKVNSWTFVPASYIFPKPSNPWNAPRFAEFKIDHWHTYNSDFIAIKMGKVWSPLDSVSSTQIRSQMPLNFIVNNEYCKANQIYKIPIRAEHFQDIEGFQFTLNYDPQHLVYQGVEAGVILINESHFGDLENGKLTSSWNSDHAETHTNDEVLFYLNFKVVEDGALSTSLNINNDVITSEAYTSDESLRTIQLHFADVFDKPKKDEIILFQNVPNPFSDHSTISYFLDNEAYVTLKICDITGRSIYQYSGNAAQGMNTFLVTKKELNFAGHYYYHLQTFKYIATKSMILNP
ncbi:MAG: T9SS type A sorting domain-containing protein [Saprospiraceae bacterium]|nr:T9SS type A sorting domain-containing protein [Candidatus Defluviibacterium haderslevense]